MYFRAPFIAYAQAAELVKPCEGTFDDPSGSAEAAAIFGVTFGKQTLDAQGFERVAMRLRIIPAVALNKVGSSTRMPALTTHRRHRFDQRQQLGDVVGIGSRYGKRQRDALSIGQDVMFGAAFAPISRVRARFVPPKTARTEELSTTVWDQSIASAWCRPASITSNTFSQTPNSCQSFRRRQHVTPLPQPISWGKYDQGIPVRKTKRMPIRAWRFGTAGRPLLFGGLSGGSSGSIIDHNSSGNSARAIPSSMQPGCTLALYKIHRQ